MQPTNTTVQGPAWTYNSEGEIQFGFPFREIFVGYEPVAPTKKAAPSPAKPKVHSSMKELGKTVAKALTWQTALKGMRSGRIVTGSRQPIVGAPVWVTPVVLHGGFASGEYAAALAEGDTPNDYFFTEQGATELTELVESGCYVVDGCPEHYALPAIMLLLRDKKYDEAQKIADEIRPWFDKLRFYPAPSDRCIEPSALVNVDTVESAKKGLKKSMQGGKRGDEKIALTRVLELWLPLKAKLLRFFAKTVEDDWPMQIIPHGFVEYASDLLAEHALITEYEDKTRTGAVNLQRRKKGTVAELIPHVRTIVACDRALSPKEVGRIRQVITGAFAKQRKRHRLKLQTVKEELEHQVGEFKRHLAMLEEIMARLNLLPAEGGLSAAQIKSVLEPDERYGKWPEAIVRSVRKTRVGTLDTLVANGVVRSSEMLAELVPQVSAAAMVPTDLATGRLFYALAQAWSKRRSLLLLNLECQVKLRELPWAIEARPNASATAHATLVLIVCTALRGFPQTIIPNKLRQCLVDLLSQAGLHVAMVDELAADIFEGRFSPKFLDAAKAAQTMLSKPDNIYATYFDLAPLWTMGAADSVGELATACKHRAAEHGCAGYGVAVNASVIEWEQILTTHSLAGLYSALNLSTKLVGSELAVTAWEWILTKLGSLPELVDDRLPVAKNIAYAWRQLVFFVSTDREGAAGAIQWMKGLATLAVQPKAGASAELVEAAAVRLKKIVKVFLKPLTRARKHNTPASNPVVGWVARYEDSFLAHF